MLGALRRDPYGKKGRNLGIAIASDERIEAALLYADGGAEGAEILSLRSFIEDGGARLRQLLAQLRARSMGPFRFPKVHPAESAEEGLETLGFRAAGVHGTLRSTGGAIQTSALHRPSS